MPLLIYLTAKPPTHEEETSPIPPELGQLCHSYCSTLQPATCSTWHNCSQAEHCSIVERWDSCKQVCFYMLENTGQEKENIVDPEEVCFQERR